MNWWHLTRKDLMLQLRDRRSFVVLLVMPLIFIAIIGLSTGQLLGWRDRNQVVKVAWIDHDRGELATRLREKLDQREEVEITLFADHEAASRAVFTGKCTLAVTVGDQFQPKIDELQLRDFFARSKGRGRLASGLAAFDISVETKPSWGWVSRLVSDTLYSLTLADIFPTVAQRHNLGRVLINNMQQAVEEEETEAAAARASANSEANAVPGEPPLTAQSVAVQTTIGEGKATKNAMYDTLIPGFTVMFAFYLVITMARSFIAERDLGTLRRLRLAPLTPAGLLIGKTLPFLLISLLQSVALFGFGRLMFDMSWGVQPLLLIPIIVCTSFAATSLGLLVATLVRTDAQVSSYTNLVVTSMAGISGCFLPRDWMPELMKHVSLGTPHAWSLIAYAEALTNPRPELSVIAMNCLVLLAFSAAFFIAGCWRFRSLK